MNEPTGLAPNDRLSQLRRRLVGGYGPLPRFYRRYRPVCLWGRISPHGRTTERYVKNYGLTVRRGQFTGMIYPPSAVGRAGYLPAKLLGCYEAELAAVMEKITDYSTFIDIGSGDGFYPVGIALRMPGVRVIGFETNHTERSLARKLAALNGVDVDFRGTATTDALNRVLCTGSRHALVLCDIEGGEQELIDPIQVPAFRHAHIIVELHPQAVPGIFNTLYMRFRETHTADLIRSTNRSAKLPELAGWDAKYANLAIGDGRTEHGEWLNLKPQADT